MNSCSREFKHFIKNVTTKLQIPYDRIVNISFVIPKISYYDVNNPMSETETINGLKKHPFIDYEILQANNLYISHPHICKNMTYLDKNSPSIYHTKLYNSGTSVQVINKPSVFSIELDTYAKHDFTKSLGIISRIKFDEKTVSITKFEELISSTLMYDRKDIGIIVS
jgi:hypothetical protein